MIVHGDCLEVMRGMDASRVDAIVTDPPYGIGFMGKEWDDPAGFWQRRAERSTKFDHIGGNHNPTCAADASRTRHVQNSRAQEWHRAWAVEALRVAKPGAHLLAFGGTRTHHRLMCAIEDAGWEIRDCLMWLYGSGFPKSLNIGNGWGTALKPAWEPIIMARKPLIGTVAANVERYGTGGTNVDGCRIGTSGGTERGDGKGHPGTSFDCGTWGVDDIGKGRFPANLLLDEDAAAMLDEQSGDLGVSCNGRVTFEKSKGYNGGWGDSDLTGTDFGDSGGASRFFYVAKASRSEREEGVTGESVRRTDGREKDTENPRLRTSSVRNHHPTVKPVSLMRWLVHLVTPPDGLVLDPFCGSGTTGVACGELGFRFVGIEMEEQYVRIAEARIEYHSRQGLLAPVRA